MNNVCCKICLRCLRPVDKTIRKFQKHEKKHLQQNLLEDPAACWQNNKEEWSRSFCAIIAGYRIIPEQLHFLQYLQRSSRNRRQCYPTRYHQYVLGTDMIKRRQSKSADIFLSQLLILQAQETWIGWLMATILPGNYRDYLTMSTAGCSIINDHQWLSKL